MSDLIPFDVKKKTKEYQEIKEALNKIEYELLQINILESKLRQQKLVLEKRINTIEQEAMNFAKKD